MAWFLSSLSRALWFIDKCWYCGGSRPIRVKNRSTLLSRAENWLSYEMFTWYRPSKPFCTNLLTSSLKIG